MNENRVNDICDRLGQDEFMDTEESVQFSPVCRDLLYHI